MFIYFRGKYCHWASYFRIEEWLISLSGFPKTWTENLQIFENR